MKLVINKEGAIQTIAEDDLSFVSSLGDCNAQRASHVNPVKHNGKLLWSADLSPVGGPVLGPFGTRTEAIKSEIEWLYQRLGLLEFDAAAAV
jgi:hypothetical protein